MLTQEDRYRLIKKERVEMRKKVIKNLYVIAVATLAILAMPIRTFASSEAKIESIENFEIVEQNDFQELIDKIIKIKEENPTLNEEQLVNLVDENLKRERGIIDIWNSLTESEKKLVIRYPFDALKVNQARNIATTQTEKKFNSNGLGDRSDAFRHGIWNAEMTVLIGKEKAELFATGHEDKDINGVEADGYSKAEHKEMDLHNNEVGRNIGEANSSASEDEMADIIYQEIYSPDTLFVWLHE